MSAEPAAIAGSAPRPAESPPLAVIVIVAGRDQHLARTARAVLAQGRPGDQLFVVEMDPAQPVDPPLGRVLDPGREPGPRTAAPTTANTPVDDHDHADADTGDDDTGDDRVGHDHGDDDTGEDTGDDTGDDRVGHDHGDDADDDPGGDDRRRDRHPIAGMVSIIRLGRPVTDGLPLAAARNAGAAAALRDGHEALLFLDVDCIPGRGALDDYRRAIIDNGPALVSGPARSLRPGWNDDGRGLDALAERSDDPGARPFPASGQAPHAVPADLFWSLAYGCTAATWRRIGGFDEAYRGYGAEDTDFGRQAACRGVPVLLIGDGVVYHQWHAPARFDPARLDGMIRNAHTFRHRWGDWPMPGWFRDLAESGHVEFDPDAALLRRRP